VQFFYTTAAVSRIISHIELKATNNKTSQQSQILNQLDRCG